MAYSEADKKAFREKDERISRTAGFNNIVALRVAEANALVAMGKTEEAVKLLDINEVIACNETLVYNYLYHGTVVKDGPVEKPILTLEESEAPQKTKTIKKKESKPTTKPLPEPNDQQAMVLDAIFVALDGKGGALEEVEAKIIDKYGRYPSNMNNVNKVVNDILEIN